MILFTLNRGESGNAVLSVPKEYSGFNGGLWASRPTLRTCDWLSFFGRPHRVFFRATTPGIFSGDHTGSPLLYHFKSSCSMQRFLGFLGYEFRATTQGRPYFIFGHSEAYPKLRIPNSSLILGRCWHRPLQVAP